MLKARFIPRQLCLLALATLLGCEPATSALGQEQLIGRWYGERVEAGLLRYWVVEYLRDGGFTAEFGYCQGGEAIADSRQSGRAYLDEHGRITTVIDESASADNAWQTERFEEAIENRYRIARVETDSIEYVLVGPGTRYRKQRVSADFEPRCPADRASSARLAGAQRDGWLRLVEPDSGTDDADLANRDVDRDVDAGAPPETND